MQYAIFTPYGQWLKLSQLGEVTAQVSEFTAATLFSPQAAAIHVAGHLAGDFRSSNPVAGVTLFVERVN